MVQTSNRAQRLAGIVNTRAAQDAAAVAGGLLVSWPIFFFIHGDDGKTAHYARLKGEFEALEKAAEKKNCEIKVERYTLEEIKEANKY